MNDTETLTEAERDIMLTRCECGHTINDHGSLGHCWTCLDDGKDDCPHDFEGLLCERVARIVAARVAAAEHQAAEKAWDEALNHVWALADPAYTILAAVDPARDESEAYLELVTLGDIGQAKRENPHRVAQSVPISEDPA